ncbi:MAG: helix-turn-helix domain-containing protein [Phycisphaeraceae bacterium]|nr:helix-turn-helix domain-containing protein [Phycisphaeraceae bacterium]
MRISSKRSPSTPAAYLERVNLAIDHIVSHLDQPVRLNRLAKIAMLSPFHFHRVFQAVIGETPADFAKRLRLEKALGLMARSHKDSLTSIAFACGFASSSDFSRSFKQRYGVPPRAFDIDTWRTAHSKKLHENEMSAGRLIERLPSRANPDEFKVRIRDLPARTVAYIRVDKPYQGEGVVRAMNGLMAWAERNRLADSQWLGYQWDNPEVTALENCRYHVAVEIPPSRLRELAHPRGEIGRFRFPAMTVAEIEIKGDIALELRALHWLYGSWLPRSGYVPDDHPGFESWIGRPFVHGATYFEIHIQLPIRRS